MKIRLIALIILVFICIAGCSSIKKKTIKKLEDGSEITVEYRERINLDSYNIDKKLSSLVFSINISDCTLYFFKTLKGRYYMIFNDCHVSLLDQENSEGMKYLTELTNVFEDLSSIIIIGKEKIEVSGQPFNSILVETILKYFVNFYAPKILNNDNDDVKAKEDVIKLLEYLSTNEPVYFTGVSPIGRYESKLILSAISKTKIISEIEKYKQNTIRDKQ